MSPKDVFQEVLDKTKKLTEEYDKELEQQRITPEEGYKEPEPDSYVQPVPEK